MPRANTDIAMWGAWGRSSTVGTGAGLPDLHQGIGNPVGVAVEHATGEHEGPLAPLRNQLVARFVPQRVVEERPHGLRRGADRHRSPSGVASAPPSTMSNR